MIIYNKILAEISNCNVYYNEGFFDYEVVKLIDIKNELKSFKNEEHYIKYFINYIKNKIIRNLPNLNLVKIELKVFDNYNILHRFILTVINMIEDYLHHTKNISLYKSIIACIKYENKIVFCGIIDFTLFDTMLET